jgi:hypothetical protein
VPVTAIDEHGSTLGWERDIDQASKARHRPVVLSEAETHAV